MRSSLQFFEVLQNGVIKNGTSLFLTGMYYLESTEKFVKFCEGQCFFLLILSGAGESANIRVIMSTLIYETFLFPIINPLDISYFI